MACAVLLIAIKIVMLFQQNAERRHDVVQVGPRRRRRASSRFRD